MANVFISYSAGDRASAQALYEFINVELAGKSVDRPHHAWFYEHVGDGTQVGADWRKVLFKNLRGADAVVCLLSANYNKSLWCTAEIATALALGRDLLPVRVGPGDEEHSMLVDYSYADWYGDVDTAKARLKSRLLDIDAMGGLAEWPKGVWPYPGLRAFERKDASVFFGRKQEMLDIVALLQSPRQLADPELITVVGPSGCGKSSLVRAAIVPYLAGRGPAAASARDLDAARDGIGRKRMWLPMRPFVPGADPLASLTRALAASVTDYDLRVDSSQFALDTEGGLKDCATTILTAAGVEDGCKLVLVVDQLEQLFSLTDAARRKAFVEALQSVLTADGPVRALATIRPEFMDHTFIDEAFSVIKSHVYQLGALTDPQLAQIIKRPAQLAGLTIDPEFVDTLVADTDGGGNLPLLALTLNRLDEFRKPGDEFDLCQPVYERSGGIQEALTTQADEAVAAAMEAAQLTDRGPVIDTLVKLVRVRGATPIRKVVDKAEFSAVEQRILDQFAARGLVVYEPRDDATLVTLGHDLLFTRWATLSEEVNKQGHFLGALDRIDSDVEEWDTSGRKASHLLTHDDLVNAMASLEVHELRGPRLRPWTRYRPEMVAHRLIDERASVFLKESIKADNRNRGRWTGAIAAVVVVVAAASGYGWVQRGEAKDALRQETITRLVSEGDGMIGQITIGGTVRGLQQVLTANALGHDSEHDALFSPVVQLSRTVKILQTPETMHTVALSPDGAVLAAGGGDGTVFMWDMASGAGRALRSPSVGQHVDVTSTRFDADGSRLYATGSDGSVHIWDVGTGAPIPTPLEPDGAATAVAIGPDGQQAAYGYADGTIRTVATDGPDGPQPPSLATGLGPVTALAYSPDGTRLVAAGQHQVGDHQEGWAQEWNLDTRAPAWPALQFAHPSPVWSVAYGRDGHIAVGGWGDGMGTIVLRAPDGQVTNIDCLSCQQPGVQSVAFNGSGTQLVSGGIDNTVRLWDTATGTQIQSALSGQTEDTRAVAISDNGKLIVSASDDKTVRIWLSPALQRTFQPMKGYDDKSVDDHLVAFSPDTARFAAATRNGQLRVWASDGGQLLKSVSTGHARLGGIGFDAAGDIATVSDDGVVELWAAQGNYAKPTEVGRLEDSGHSVGVSRDGTRVIAGGGRSLKVWTPGAAPLRITTPAEVTSVAFSRDGALVAYGTGDGKLQAVRIADGKPLFAEPQQADSGDSSHFTNVAAVAFSPDGTRLAAGAKGDDKVRLWNLRTGKGFEMKGHHEGDVVDVDFTGDGRYVVSAGYDDTVQLWNADTGQRVGTPLFDEHGDVTAIGITSDDMIIRASRREGVVSNWPGPAIWQPALCRKLSYNMNQAQWQSWVKLPEGQYVRACDQLQQIPDGWSAP